MKLFDGLYTVQNEYKEIRIQHFVQGMAQESLKNSHLTAYETMKNMKQPLPALVTSDKCCADRNYLEYSWPSLTKKVLRPKNLALPLSAFMGAISDDGHINVLCSQLLDWIVSNLVSVVSLDTEWNFFDNPSKISKNHNSKDDGKIKCIQLAFNMDEKGSTCNLFLNSQFRACICLSHLEWKNSKIVEICFGIKCHICWVKG
jgi:hypothetical protein